MNFDGTEGGKIALDEAAKLTANHRAQNPDGVHSIFFGREIIQKILNQEAALGIRIYLGAENDGTPKLVLVGADSTGNDIIDGVIANYGVFCPPGCSTRNSLNADL